MDDWRPIEPGQCALCGHKSSRPKTLVEFCQHWRMCRDKFYELKAIGKAPATIKIGKTVLITREAEDAWVRLMTETQVSVSVD